MDPLLPFALVACTVSLLSGFYTCPSDR